MPSTFQAQMDMLMKAIRALDERAPIKTETTIDKPTVTAPNQQLQVPSATSTPQVSPGTSDIQAPQYPEPPKRTALADNTPIEVGAYGGAVGLGTAAKMLRKEENLRAANEAVEGQSWLEKMRDVSDTYKADANLERDKRRYDYMSELEGKKAENRNWLESMRTGSKEKLAEGKAGLEREKMQSREKIETAKISSRERIQREARELRQSNPTKFNQMAKFVDNYVSRMNMEGASEDDKALLYESAWEKAKLEVGGELPKEPKASTMPNYADRPSTQKAERSLQLDEEASKILNSPDFINIVSGYEYDSFDKSIVDKDGNPISPGALASKIKGGTQDAKIKAINRHFFGR